VKPFEGGWTFTSEKFTVKDAQFVRYFRVGALACDKWSGKSLQMTSDEKDGVVLMAYEIELGIGSGERGKTDFCVRADERFGFTGWRCGFAAGPKGRLRDALKAMTVARALPYTTGAGAWALDNEVARGSFVTSYASLEAMDDWIDACLRGGALDLHLHIWYRNQGHYDMSPTKFPNGLADFTRATDKLRAAGLVPSMHCLTACISMDDPYVTPVASPDLQYAYRYTLAEPLTKDSKEVVVNEVPGEDHDLVATYSSRGNYLRIGGEIVQYAGIRREKPYAFTGIVRGALKTKSFDHAAGENADYLSAWFSCFFPVPGSPTAEAIAKRLAEVYSAGRIERVFLDGSEGISRGDYSRFGAYGIARMHQSVFDAIDQSRSVARFDVSCNNRHGWWYLAYGHPWDVPNYGFKYYADDRVTGGSTIRDSDFLMPQFGWWNVSDGTKVGDDDVEYFASRLAGHDAVTSISGMSRIINDRPISLWMSRGLTLLGWYERFRLARAFRPEVTEAFRRQGDNFHLAQDESGEWRVWPVAYGEHRIDGRKDFAWTYAMPGKSVSARLRLAAFGGCSRYQDAAENVVFNAKDAGRLKVKAARGVKLEVSTGNDRRRGKTLVLRGENTSGKLEGSWAGATLDFPRPYLDIAPAAGIGFWVKGDGSGATLDVQLNGAREYADVNADHLVTLDFEGWRYFSFLFDERDITRLRREKWPFSVTWNTLKVKLRPEGIASVAFYLNSIPGAGTEANVFMDENQTRSAAEIAAGGAKVEISEVRAIDREEFPINNPRFTVNGRKFRVPFDALEAGDVAEYADGFWTLRDPAGTLKERAKAEDELNFREGDNRIAFSGSTFGPAVRAEVRLFGMTKSVPALRAERDPQMGGGLDYEAQLPDEVCPAKGVGDLAPVRVRPGEKARLEAVVFGPVRKPAFVRKGVRSEFPVALKTGDRLFCRDGVNWKVIDAKRREIASGTLANPLPVLFGGSNAVSFDCADREDADVRVELVKRYFK